MINRSANYSIKHGQSTPLTVRTSNTVLTFVPSVGHSFSVASNNCLHKATYIFELNRLCNCNFILIGMIVTDSGYIVLALPIGRGVEKDGLLVGWKLTEMLTETINTVWMKSRTIKWHIL